MKCELCHNADAETAIVRVEHGEEEELYVCRACAKAEKLKRSRRFTLSAFQGLNGTPSFSKQNKEGVEKAV